jgi:3-phytase
MNRHTLLLLIPMLAAVLAGCGVPTVRTLQPTVETAPVPHAGDAADDPAIWVDPADPARSLIIGTDKRGGIAVYDLAGTQLQYRPDGELNNVDLRDNVALGAEPVSLVTAGNRTTNTMLAYRVVPGERGLQPLPLTLSPTIEIYGSCMYRDAGGRLFVFITSKSGVAEQWELLRAGAGFTGTRVRSFDVGGQTEGCVADDARGLLYVAEEAVSIWQYSAAPDANEARVAVDRTGPGGHLTSNIEGLALAGPWLIASSQGNSTFAFYRRSDNAYQGSFRIGASAGIDGVSDTDGIEATAAALGPQFPQGVLVVQDGSNDAANQNFKLVPLQALAPG